MHHTIAYNPKMTPKGSIANFPLISNTCLKPPCCHSAQSLRTWPFTVPYIWSLNGELSLSILFGEIASNKPLQSAVECSGCVGCVFFNTSEVHKIDDRATCGKQHYYASGCGKAIFLLVSEHRIRTVARQKLATCYLLGYPPRRRWLLWRMIVA